MLDNLFGITMRKVRKHQHLTETDVANKLDVSRGSINSYERGKCEPGLDMLLGIAKVLNVTPNQLLGVDPIDDNYLSDKEVNNNESIQM